MRFSVISFDFQLEHGIVKVEGREQLAKTPARRCQ